MNIGLQVVFLLALIVLAWIIITIIVLTWFGMCMENEYLELTAEDIQDDAYWVITNQ